MSHFIDNRDSDNRFWSYVLVSVLSSVMSVMALGLAAAALLYFH